MQSLNVGVFQSYKHWHDQIIQDAVVTSFVEYSMWQFLNDLTKIRNNTFKASIIRHAFEKFEMWSVDQKQCIKQLKRFNKQSTKFTLHTLSLLRQTHELTDIQHGLENYWDFKIAENMQWSSLSRKRKYLKWVDDTKQMIANSLVKETKLNMWRTTREKELNRKKFSRRRVQLVTGDLGLTKEDADRVIAAKFQKKQNMKQKKINVNFMKMWRMKRKEMHSKGVTVRKVEKSRIKQMKEMTKNHLFISVELLQLIHDLEVEWKTINEIWLVEQEKKDRKKKSRLEKSADDDEEDDDLEFIVDKFSDENDFIAFENENENENAPLAGENAPLAEDARHENFSIEDEFNPGDFFDEMDDERAFQALYS